MISYLGVIRTVMIADTSQFNRGMLMASQQMRDSALRMRRDAQSLVGIGAALNVGITMPFTLAARSVIKYGAEYQAVMMKMRHVSGLTVAEFKKLEDAQTRISKSVGIDPQKLGNIGYLGAQAQLKGVGSLTTFQRVVSKAMKTMPGESTPESVAEGFLSVIKAFDIEEKDFSRTMAEMIKTIDLGRISWQQYTTTIQQVVALASSLKTTDSLKNMNISIAAATLGGVSGSKAATAIRNLYRRVYKEGGQEGSMMNMAAGMFGYRDKRGKGSAVRMFEDGAGGDLAKFSQMITASGKLATPEYANAMGIMAREFTAFLKLANTAPEELSRFSKEYDNAEKEIADRYIEAQKQIVSKLENLGAAWGRLRAQFLTSKASDMLSRLLDNLVSLFDKIGSLPDVSKNLVILAGALASLGSVAVLLTGIYKSAALTWRLNKLITTGAIPSFLSTNATAGNAASVTKAGSLGAMRVTAANCNVTGRVVNVFGKTLGGKTRSTRGSGYTKHTPFPMGTAAGTTQGFHHPYGYARLGTGAGATQMRGNMLGMAPWLYGPTRKLLGSGGGYTKSGQWRSSGGQFGNKAKTAWLGHMLPNYTGPLRANPIRVDPTGVAHASGMTAGYASPPPYAMQKYSGAGKYEMVKSTVATSAYGAKDVAKTSAILGFVGKSFTNLGKSIGGLLPKLKGALVWFGIMAAKFYVVTAVFAGLGEALSVTLLPVLHEFGFSLSGLWKILGQINIFIVRGLAVAFVTLMGVLQNVFGVIIGVGTLAVQTFDYVFTLIRRGFEGLIDTIRNSWIGRRFGWELSDSETASRRRNRDEARGKEFRDIGEWQKYIREQAAGIIGLGDSSAAIDNINKLADKWWGGQDAYKKTPRDKQQADGSSDPTPQTHPAIDMPDFTQRTSDFLEYGTSAEYQAVQEGRNNIVDLLQKIRDEAKSASMREIDLAEQIAEATGQSADTLISLAEDK